VLPVIDERARHQLYLAVEEVLGTERADTLMSLLPPVGWADVATKDDIHLVKADIRVVQDDIRRVNDDLRDLRGDLHDLEERLDERMDARFGLVDARFAALEVSLDARFEKVDARFVGVDKRFDEFELRLEAKLERALRDQLRVLMFGLLGALFTMSSLCLGAIALIA
jgi:hypothetical protein